MGENGHGRPPTPFLLIPYTSTDDGLRPLPASIPMWICPSIHLNGLPYTGAALNPGSSVSLSVVLKNLGALGALVTVRLYFANPTTAFTLSNVTFIGQTLFLMSALSSQESPTINWNIPPTIPSHVCLLAEATCPGDQSSGTFDIVNDRHYSQQNINILTVQKGQKTSFEFFVANAGLQAARFTINAHEVNRDALQYLSRIFNSEPFSLTPVQLNLRVVEPGQAGLQILPSGLVPQIAQTISLELKPQEQRLCQLVIDVPPNFEPHQFFAVELQQSHSEDLVVGAVGVVAFHT